jgi:hypothetical protein
MRRGSWRRGSASRGVAAARKGERGEEGRGQRKRQEPLPPRADSPLSCYQSSTILFMNLFRFPSNIFLDLLTLEFSDMTASKKVILDIFCSLDWLNLKWLRLA